MILNDSNYHEKYQQLIEPLMEKLDDVFMEFMPEHLVHNLWECMMIRTDPARPPGSDFLYSTERYLLKLMDVAEGLIACDTEQKLRIHDTNVRPVDNPGYVARGEHNRVKLPAVLQLADLSAVNYADYLDPYRVLYLFFEKRPRALWEKQIRYWCSKESLSEVPPELSVPTMMDSFHTLARFIEASYLLTEIQWNGNINTPIDYFFQTDHMPSSIPAEDMLNPYEAVCYCFISEGPERLMNGLTQWEQAAIYPDIIWEPTIERLKLLHAIQYIVEFAYILSSLPSLNHPWLDTRTWKIDLSAGVPSIPQWMSSYTEEELSDPFHLLTELDMLFPGAFREVAFDWLVAAGSPQGCKLSDVKKFERIRQTIEVMLAIVQYVVRKKNGDYLTDMDGTEIDNSFDEDLDEY